MILQTLLVTGGDNGVSSSELYVDSASAWSYAASLPSPRSSLTAATLGNSVFVFGDYDP